jgi:uncharacterized membrane protein YkoI
MRLGIVAAACGLVAAALGFAGAVRGAPPAGEDEGCGAEALEAFEVLAADLLAPADALARAAKDAGEASPYEIELGTAKKGEKRVAVWEVGFLAGEKKLEVKVDARSGEVLSRETEDDPAEVKVLKALLGRGKVGLDGALATLGGSVQGLLLKAEIDDEEDAAVFEAVLLHSGRATEVLVSTASGKIVPDDGEDDDGPGDDDGEDGDEDGDDEAGKK